MVHVCEYVKLKPREQQSWLCSTASSEVHFLLAAASQSQSHRSASTPEHQSHPHTECWMYHLHNSTGLIRIQNVGWFQASMYRLHNSTSLISIQNVGWLQVSMYHLHDEAAVYNHQHYSTDSRILWSVVFRHFNKPWQCFTDIRVAWCLSGRALDMRFTGRGFHSWPVAFT